jgi:peptidoglycan-associated lipoprotein
MLRVWKCRRGEIAALSLFLVLGACGTDTGADGPTTPPPLQPVSGQPDGGQIAGGQIGGGYESVPNTVYFETDAYTISNDAENILQQQANWLRANAATTVTIEGHADERGTREYNLALAERRAHATAGYLAALGIDAKRLNILSYGKERPLCAESATSCWAQNRRAVTALNP